MSKIVGKSSSPRRLKYYLYRKIHSDLYNLLLKDRKFSRLNYRILKNFEYLVFRKLMKWAHATPTNYYTQAFLIKKKQSKINSYILSKFRKNSRFLNRLHKFNDNLNTFVNLKNENKISYVVSTTLLKLLRKRKGKLGYLNWSMFYAHQKDIRIIRGRKNWLHIGRKRHIFKKKNVFIHRDVQMKKVSLFYGYTNMAKFKKMFMYNHYSSQFRKKAALNLEGKISTIIYRLNLMDNISNINKLVKRGKIKLNNSLCYNPHHVLKKGDNLNIHPSIYRFIINIFKKRLKNRQIWGAIPEYIEVNYRILYFSLIDYPTTFDLIKFNNHPPFSNFNSDVVNIGNRHIIKR